MNKNIARKFWAWGPIPLTKQGTEYRLVRVVWPGLLTTGAPARGRGREGEWGGKAHVRSFVRFVRSFLRTLVRSFLRGFNKKRKAKGPTKALTNSLQEAKIKGTCLPHEAQGNTHPWYIHTYHTYTTHVHPCEAWRKRSESKKTR